MRLVSTIPLLAVLSGCSDQPLGPDRRLQIDLLGSIPADSLGGHPADTLTLEFRVSDLLGAPVSGAAARYRVEGEGAVLLSGDPATAGDGRLSVRWQLGIRASETQVLELELLYGEGRESLALQATVVPTEVASLAAESVATRLHTPASLPVTATDPYGNVFVPEVITYASSDTGVFVIDSAGVIHGRSRGLALAIATSGDQADSSQVHVFQVVDAIQAADTLDLHALGQFAAIGFTVVSDSGRPVRDTIPSVIVGDTAIATIHGSVSDSAVPIRAGSNGSTTVTLAIGAAERSVTVVVRQKSAMVTLSPATIPGFDALNDSVRLTAIAVDSLGQELAAPVITWSTGDSSVIAVNPGGWVRSVGNGTTTVTAEEVTGASASLAASVSQAADSLEVFWTDTAAIVSGAQFAPPPLTCLARDRNGFPLSESPTVASRTGTLLGGNCATLTVRMSGHDTLTFSSGSVRKVLPTVLAVRPLVSTPVGDFVSLDSFPSDLRLWAPSGRLNAQGQTEIYVTGYLFVQDSNGVGPGALHRLVSSDGLTFQYDGIALDLLPPPCELICSGIENIAVVERDDGPGWRMYFAAGSTGTYGWQIFSAVSTDERTWTIEPGVRITNGGSVPPAPPGAVPWPVGEGLVVDQLPSGEWRMIVGGYDRIPNPPNRFDIVEYRSPDQLNWSYQGTILTAAEAPATAARSVYSPSIAEFTPGIWRMFFTGDDLHLPGGRSRIFSAVSTDRIQWKIESELLGAAGTDLYYTALVNDRLYFLRQDVGQLRRLAAVTLTMP